MPNLQPCLGDKPVCAALQCVCYQQLLSEMPGLNGARAHAKLQSKLALSVLRQLQHAKRETTSKTECSQTDGKLASLPGKPLLMPATT